LAKDTEKLIRQLSLISYLMAERRPVTATEIRRDVEGYSDMTEDAFARRFYADRAELDALGIHLRVDKPADGFSEQENYSLAPEAFHLPAIAFSDTERAALQTALTLLDGEFAYAEPLRLALQQITWGRPSPLGSDSRQTIGLGITASAGGSELSARLAKVDTAIYRRKRIEFAYYTMQTGETAMRKVDPYHLLFEGGQWYLVGHAHERDAVRVFRLSRIRGKVAYSTKAEHDFQRPADFDPRGYANRIPWQLGDPVGTGEVWVSDKIAWYVERQFGAYGAMTGVEDGRIFRTEYAIPRLLVSWALRFGEDAHIVGPPELVEESRTRLDLIIERHRGEPFASVSSGTAPSLADVDADGDGRARGGDTSIRPERFARLVTLASVLIAAGRAERRVPMREVCDQLQISEQELREDISVLNVVNFGGGAYVIYAEVLPSGEIEVDPEPYSDTFDRPARLLPIEANALVAAIDLIGTHLAQGALASARKKIVAALGHDPVEEGLQVITPTAADEITRTVETAVHESRRLEIEYWAPNEDAFSERVIEPYALFNGQEAWYVAAVDPAKEDLRHFRLDRIKRATPLDQTFERREDLDPVADIGGWPRTGKVEGSRVAHVWISPEQARWAREERTVLAELEGGAVIVEWAYKGTAYLVREVLKEAGDAAVLEPADARGAVLAAAEGLLAPSA
jgi:predicted DNA-binding transcriptional regulator YafY